MIKPDFRYINQQMSLISLIRQIENKTGKEPTLFETLNKMDIEDLTRMRDELIIDKPITQI